MSVPSASGVSNSTVWPVMRSVPRAPSLVANRYTNSSGAWCGSGSAASATIWPVGIVLTSWMRISSITRTPSSSWLRLIW
jgi:hypothetical protein